MAPPQITPTLPTGEDRLRHIVRTLAKMLFWFPTDDKEITCVVCGLSGCDIEARTLTNGTTSWYGAHEACLEEKGY